MPDDIRDLLGRYATGSLTPEEQKRLSDAALDDQEIFDQLAQEQDLKRLLEEPGARDRLIQATRALEPPKRRLSWIFALAPVAIVSALVLVYVMRPAPKAPPVVVVMQAPPPPVAPMEVANNVPAPTPVEEPAKTKVTPPATSASSPPSKDAENQVADRKEDTTGRDELKKAEAPKQAAAPIQMDKPVAASQSQRVVAAEQAGSSGPRQQAPSAAAPAPKVQAARAAAAQTDAVSALLPAFGFHYSVETKGHLIVVPSADGYLTVKSNDGTILLDRKPFAAGILADIPLPAATSSVTVAFSTAATPVETAPARRTAPEGTVRGTTGVAIEIKINP
jgi:hypothetical protein